MKTLTDWRSQTQPTDDGHLLWIGHRHHGTPSFYIGKRHHSAPAHVYTTHHGRPPVGKVTTHCRVPCCVLPEHLLDYNDRQELYRANAEKRLRPRASGFCANGHRWEDNAEYQRGGQRNCNACRSGQAPVLNDLAVEFALAGVPEELARPDELEAVRRAICIAGLTHAQAAPLVGRSPRTVSRWAKRHGWKKPALR
jgi:hypothetical protein